MNTMGRAEDDIQVGDKARGAVTILSHVNEHAVRMGASMHHASSSRLAYPAYFKFLKGTLNCGLSFFLIGENEFTGCKHLKGHTSFF